MFTRNASNLVPSSKSLSDAAHAVVESLEGRALFSVALEAGGTELVIKGTAAGDNVQIGVESGKFEILENGVMTKVNTGIVNTVRFFGYDGDDYFSIYGFGGNTVLNGGNHNDFLRGSFGPDALFGGPGNDKLDGGSGSDYFNGGTGIDTADYSSYGAPVSISLGSTTLKNDGMAGEGDDIDISVENAIGGSGNDTLIGSVFSNELIGNAGNDTIQGLAGDDKLRGGNGLDTLRGGDGWDSLYGDDGDDKLFGEAGNDILYGGNHNDFLVGGLDNDKLFGESGNDSLYGEAGDDTLDGGTQRDTMAGGTGVDKVDFTWRTTNVRITLDGVADDGAAGELDNVLADIENVYAGPGNDHIVGNSADNRISGGGGNDYINGLAGNDTLFGDAGHDRILGASGTDGMYGGLGNDTLVSIDGKSEAVYGGVGNDILWINSTDITDGDAAEKAAGNYIVVNSYANGVSIEPAGQDLADPSLAGLADRDARYGPRFDSNPLFPAGEPAVNEVVQRQLGSCYVLATLSGVAKGRPGLLRQLVTDLGDGTFAVRYHVNGKFQAYRVDSQLPVDAYGNPAFAGTVNKTMWVAIMEKAYAVAFGGGKYESIEGGIPSTVFRQLGKSADYWLTAAHSEASMAAKINDVLSKGGSVVASSDLAIFVTGVETPHAYTVTAINGSTIILRNPWGSDGTGGNGDPNDGIITMSMSRFDDDFIAFYFSYL